MQQSNTQEIKINNLQTDIKLLNSNTSLHIQQTNQSFQQINEKMKYFDEQLNQNIRGINNLEEQLNQRVESIFQKHEQELINKIQNIEKEKELNQEEEIKKRIEMSNKFKELDELLKQLDKKFEQKANDKFIVSVIQNNLINNQNLQQSLVEKSIKLIDEHITKRIDEMQKWTEEKIQQQYYQIQNFQTYLRKSERSNEELQSAIILIKNSTIEFEKEFNKQITDMTLKNQVFKETIQYQVKNTLSTNQELKQQFQQLQNEIKSEFEQQKKLREEDQHLLQYRFDACTNFMQFTLKTSEQKLLSQMQKENQEITQILNDKQFEQFQHLQKQIELFEEQFKQQNEEFLQFKEKLNGLLKKNQVHSRLYQKSNTSATLNLRQNKKDQIAIIENLFQYISQIYEQIHKNVSIESETENQYETIQDGASMNSKSQSQVILIEEQISTKKINVSPSKSPERYYNNINDRNETKVSDKILKNKKKDQTQFESIRIHDRSPFKSQDRDKPSNIQYMSSEKISDEQFSDLRIQDSLPYPLLVVGKTQIIDTRPQQELNILQQKLKKVQNLIGVDLLGSKVYTNPYQVHRSNSAQKKLPKINSRSLNFSID